MNSMINDWRMELIGLGKSANTVKVYASDLRLYSEFIGQDDLDNVSLSELLEYRDWIVESYNRQTAMRRISSLRMFYTWRVESGITFDFDPSDIQQLQFERTMPIWLTDGQYSELVDYAQHSKSRIACALNILLQSAIKRGELQRITQDNVSTSKTILIIDWYAPHLSHKNRIVELNKDSIDNWLTHNPVDARTLESDIEILLDAIGANGATWESVRWATIARWYDSGLELHKIQSTIGASNALMAQIVSILESR